MMKTSLYFIFKRLFDLSVSLTGLILLLPIFLIIILLQFLTYGPKIMFYQKRVGLHGVIFKIYKFKTMNEKHDDEGHLLPDHLRVTKLGKILRSFSLDELPQIFNILDGQMSIVGPRPQSIENCLFMNAKQFKRHQVKPGLTGLAAIKGRNGIPWSKKIALDLEYIERKSFYLDLKIIIITVIKVFKREFVSTNGHVTSLQMGEELLKQNHLDVQTHKFILKKARSFSTTRMVETDLLELPSQVS